MSDTKSGDDKTLSVTPKKTLTLKRPGLEQGTVRQNFSHGRTKSVVVETKKRKFSLPGDKPEPVAPSVFTPKPAAGRGCRHGRRRRGGQAEAYRCWRQRWRRCASSPSRHARGGASGKTYQGRGRPPPRQADAEFGAVG